MVPRRRPETAPPGRPESGGEASSSRADLGGSLVGEEIDRLMWKERTVRSKPAPSGIKREALGSCRWCCLRLLLPLHNPRAGLAPPTLPYPTQPNTGNASPLPHVPTATKKGVPKTLGVAACQGCGNKTFYLGDGRELFACERCQSVRRGGEGKGKASLRLLPVGSLCVT